MLLPAPALAGTARVDHVADGTPTVVFQGGGEVNNVGVNRVVPGDKDEIDYFFSDSSPITAGPGCSHPSAGATTQVTCVIPGRSESFGHIRLGGGNDDTSVGFTSIALDGQAGDDTVQGHVGITGGPGNDTVTGTAIGDVFFVAAGDGTDTINGGGGVDALRLENPGTLDMRGTPDTITGVEELDGSQGNDTIFADDRVIDPGTGAGWTVVGFNGDDHLVAGAAPALLSGNDGNDRLDGGSANDRLSGGDGDDLLAGNGGDDTLNGDDGRDTLEGGAGHDSFFGADGEDLLLSVDGVAETLNCGNDTDRTIADGIDTIGSDCELSGLDSDGDGLKDDWEQHGLDVDGDGHVDVDLPAMGAKVNRKDVFVELDFMPPHKLAQAGINKVIAAFKAAPVPNPDGSTGITLHVDNGPTSVMNPVTGATWGSRSKQSSIPHQTQTGSVTGGNYDWSAFDALKAVNFDPNRAPIFHYAISAHAHDGTFSGNSRGVTASDFMVTLGAGCQALQGSDCTMDADAQAGTFMHELGHNLGLRHGGGDDIGYKPNYLSVMNYAYQLPGLLRANLTTRIDYSRFALSVDETALDENTGFGVAPAGPGADLLATVRCPNNSQHLETLLAGTVDFDCNGTIKTPGTVAVDINHDGDQFTLDGFEDWPALTFAGGAIGGEGRPVEAVTTSDEVPLQELVADRKTIDDYIAAHQPQPGGPGPAPPGGGQSTTPPVQTAAVRLSALRVKRAANRRLKVTYRLSRATTVVFRIQRRKGHRWVTLHGSLKHASKAGKNTFRISAKRLKKGRYRLVARPRGGPAVRAKFAVTR